MCFISIYILALDCVSNNPFLIHFNSKESSILSNAYFFHIVAGCFTDFVACSFIIISAGDFKLTRQVFIDCSLQDRHKEKWRE